MSNRPITSDQIDALSAFGAGIEPLAEPVHVWWTSERSKFHTQRCSVLRGNPTALTGPRDVTEQPERICSKCVAVHPDPRVAEYVTACWVLERCLGELERVDVALSPAQLLSTVAEVERVLRRYSRELAGVSARAERAVVSARSRVDGVSNSERARSLRSVTAGEAAYEVETLSRRRTLEESVWGDAECRRLLGALAMPRMWTEAAQQWVAGGSVVLNDDWLDRRTGDTLTYLSQVPTGLTCDESHPFHEVVVPTWRAARREAVDRVCATWTEELDRRLSETDMSSAVILLEQFDPNAAGRQEREVFDLVAGWGPVWNEERRALIAAVPLAVGSWVNILWKNTTIFDVGEVEPGAVELANGLWSDGTEFGEALTAAALTTAHHR